MNTGTRTLKENCVLACAYDIAVFYFSVRESPACWKCGKGKQAQAGTGTRAAKVVKLAKLPHNQGWKQKSTPYFLYPDLRHITKALDYFANPVVPLKARQRFTTQTHASPHPSSRTLHGLVCSVAICFSNIFQTTSEHLP